MADFTTALEALGQGRISVDALGKQLEKLLKQTPQHAIKLLEHLDEAYGKGIIDDKAYAALKRQINQYRRTHAAETEKAGTGGTDATVFAQEDNFETGDGDESEEATEVKGGAESETRPPSKVGSEDITVSKSSGAGDSTRIMEDGEKPTSTGGLDIDISSPESGSSFPPSSGPTGTDWQQPLTTEAAIIEEMGPGSVIKQRFKLLEVLGVGGMGKVYKGIDLLKEEARDKNPFIAIKLLNEDFKSHPEAFIALQRESSRQQKLAHPNIATVYDFDRIGGPGTPVFITMELMEGQPLNTYIKKVVRKQNGLPFPEAFTIVKQLGAALMYAHERRLVHSDFKPGNAFLCNDGTVKTLDFGIARAVKNPITGEGEKTLFDPGKLGALTPAYASLEMLEGEEPDPRDDIYALGCVAYELLTTKHPFNKLPANTAKENGLVPAPIKGLNKKQNRALKRALAFRREDRCATVEEFIEEFEGKFNYKSPYFIAAVVAAIAVVALFFPAMNYWHKKSIERVVAQINSGDKQVIVTRLAELPGMDKADQTAITDSARDAIQKYFSSEIARYTDIGGNQYNFPVAQKVLGQAKSLYPQSLFVQNQQNEIDLNKKQILADLYNKYIAALDPQTVQQNPTSIDATKAILNTIRQRIDPQHPLLTDPRPANAYRLAGEQALADANYDQALKFVTSGLQTAPDDQRLSDLKAKVENTMHVAQLRETLGGAQFASLADYKQHEKDIVDLANLSTSQDSPVLTTLSDGLKGKIEDELSRISKDGNRADAENLAKDYGPVLIALELQSQLTRVKLAHLAGDQRTQMIQQLVTADQSVATQKLSSPNIKDPAWESQLLASIRELDSLKGEDPSVATDLQGYREQIAKLYTEEADTLLKANRFDAADGVAARGQRFAPDLPTFQETRTAIAQAKADYEKQQHINDLKEQFKFQTEADRVAEAQKVFDQLKAVLPPDDIYVTSQAPGILADSYSRLAQRSAESNDYRTALQLADKGLELSPRNPTLKSIDKDYRIEVNIVDLAGVFKNAGVFSTAEVDDIARKVNEIEQGAPTRYPEFRKQSESALSDRIKQLAQSNKNGAAALADAAARIFPTSSVLADLSNQFQLEPWPEQGLADAALQSGELTRAQKLLETAKAGKYATHPQVLAFEKDLGGALKEANDAYSTYEQALTAAKDDYNALRQSQKLLLRAQSAWVDNPQFDKAATDLDQAIADSPGNPAKKVIARETLDIAAASAEQIKKAAEEWKPVSSGRECNTGLAGYGRRARAICYDLVNTGWRGPLMVVVPAGGSFEKSFAIGKYELSVGDWSKYCALSGNCKPETDKQKFDDPVTGITLQQAKDYLKWLSDRTGKTYRLPTDAEWNYAATEGGKLTDQSEEFKLIKGTLNCRVTMGDKVLKGTGTASVKSGGSNEWGLKNFVGNVQEMVLENNGSAVVRGGAYSDSISNCDMSTTRPLSSSTDGSTGLRVVLEDVG